MSAIGRYRESWTAHILGAHGQPKSFVSHDCSSAGRVLCRCETASNERKYRPEDVLQVPSGGLLGVCREWEALAGDREQAPGPTERHQGAALQGSLRLQGAQGPRESPLFPPLPGSPLASLTAVPPVASASGLVILSDGHGIPTLPICSGGFTHCLEVAPIPRTKTINSLTFLNLVSLTQAFWGHS